MWSDEKPANYISISVDDLTVLRRLNANYRYLNIYVSIMSLRLNNIVANGNVMKITRVSNPFHCLHF
jgi:hypothetical protein